MSIYEVMLRLPTELNDLKSPIGVPCSEIRDREESALNIEQGLTSDDIRWNAGSAHN